MAMFRRTIGLALIVSSGVAVREASAETVATPTLGSDPARQLAGTASVSKAAPESLVLFGTGSLDKGSLACFGGSNAAFRRDLRLGEKIGEFVVTEIAFSRVRLKTGELEFQMPVGSRLVREPGGPWKLAGIPEDISSPGEFASSRAQSPASKVSGILTAPARASAAGSDDYTQWVGKKLSKYSREAEAEFKAEKHARKMLEGRSEESSKNPAKQFKKN